MTVKELIEELRAYDDNLQVHFSYNYGDHWRTRVAPEVASVEEQTVAHSDYHDMPKLIDEDGREKDAKLVVVLSS